MAKTNYIKNTTLLLLYLLVLTGCNKTRLGMQADNGHDKNLEASSSIACSENKKAKIYRTKVQELIDKIHNVSNGYLWLDIPNDISEEEFKEILATLCCNKSIRWLHLNVRLSIEKVKGVLATLCDNPSIYKLCLSGCGYQVNLRSLGASTLGSLLSMLKDTNVKELDLSFNDLGLLSAQDFAFVLSSLRDTKIHTLNLSHNRLYSLGARLKDALSMLSNTVHTLYLDYNFVFLDDIRELGPILSGMGKKKIHTLSLARNGLNGLGGRAPIDLGTALSELAKLEVHILDLAGNTLSGGLRHDGYVYRCDDLRSILWKFENSKLYTVSMKGEFSQGSELSDPVLMERLAHDFRAHIALPNYLKHGEGLKGLCIETIQKHIASIDKVDALLIPLWAKEQIKNTYEGQIGLLYKGIPWAEKAGFKTIR